MKLVNLAIHSYNLSYSPWYLLVWSLSSLYCRPKGFRLSLPEKKENSNNNNADAHEILVAANNYINQRFLKRFEFQVLKLSMASATAQIPYIPTDTHTHTHDKHV